MKYLIIILFSIASINASAQAKYSQALSKTVLKLWPDSFSMQGRPGKWSYDQGVILKGIEGVWYATGDGEWFKYIQKQLDHYVQEDGTIKGYRAEEFNIDHINNGKLILLLYKVTGKEKYKKAADLLRSQLKSHPRTSEGGFWHKKIYPYQMWLDGLYMGQPFYSEYAQLFHEDSAFNDITRQFVLMEKHARDVKTGLLYHGWDESKAQKWANQTTGLSPHVWARAMGWYGMAMVDALEFFPANHPGKKTITDILDRYADAVNKVQDKNSGVWFDIIDKQTTPKNYKEASASCMITYTLAKGIRKGYLNEKYLSAARKAYAGILKEFIKEENGQTNLHGTVAVSGLGGNPYRDGSFDYYMSEPVIVNDAKGMGAFIKCAVEMEKFDQPQIGKNKTVLLDRYFNSEKRKDVTGLPVYWHYTWEERSHPGFSLLGDIFNSYGARLSNLDIPPTKADLNKASVYIVVDPDHVKDNPAPNYITEQNAQVISDWVKGGGVLLLMANDSSNCDLGHTNLLASKFGVSFTDKSVNMVKNDEFETGVARTLPGQSLFQRLKMYLKEVSALQVSSPAIAVAGNAKDPLIAISKYGKGSVILIGDPWIYNEYIDGRKLLPGFDNYKAGHELVKWLLSQSK